MPDPVRENRLLDTTNPDFAAADRDGRLTETLRSYARVPEGESATFVYQQTVGTLARAHGSEGLMHMAFAAVSFATRQPSSDFVKVNSSVGEPLQIAGGDADSFPTYGELADRKAR